MSSWAVGVLVIALIVLGFFWLRGGKDSTDAPNTENNEQATTTVSNEVESTNGPVASVNRANMDVAAIVASLPEASRFAQLFASSGVAASIPSTGKYTIFVPTNGAFALLPPGTINNMTAAQLKRTMQYHVVSGRVIDPDAVNTGTIQALSKDMINFDVRESDKSVLVGSGFVIKEYRGKNGVVYLMTAVLIPPEKGNI